MPTLLLCVLLAGSPVLGGEVLLAQQEKKVLMNFDSTRLVEVVKWMSKNTGRNYIVPENLRQRTLTVFSATPVTVQEAREAFSRALALEGLEVVEDGKFSSILPLLGRTTGAEPPLRPAACVPEFTVTPTGKDQFRVGRSDLDGVLSNVNCLAQQARFVPAFADGKCNGFKLFAIRPNSLYAQLGLQNGDVIRRVNGMELASPEKALEIYTKLRQASIIELEISRRGEPLKLTYSID